MSIRIIKQGIMANIQSLPRHGCRHLGIGTGGGMDPFAMQVANFLVGNEESAAVIEMNFPAPEILFQQEAMISLAGADFDACVGEGPVPLWKPVLLKKGTIIRFRKPVMGSKLYLAVRGGWNADEWLGSKSTNLRAIAGGYCGRTLQKEDVIGFEEQENNVSENKILPWGISPADLLDVYPDEKNIRCNYGPEWDLLSPASKLSFDRQDFAVSGLSDRMGYRLSGTKLDLVQPVEMVSSAVDAGTVQLLPDGNLIVLMADHQTTGGYPRIASVIKADMPALAQSLPGKMFRFKMTGLLQAEDALISMQLKLGEIKTTCKQYCQNYFQH